MACRLITHSKEVVCELLKKKITTSFLILTLIIIFSSQHYYFIPYLKEQENVKISYIEKAMQERYEMKAKHFVFILKSIALTNHIGVWINSILIENNTVVIEARAFDAISISEYIQILTKNSKLIIDSITTSHIKKLSKKNKEEQGKNIPLAYLRFLEMEKKIENLENSPKQKNIEYFYNSKIKLLRKRVL